MRSLKEMKGERLHTRSISVEAFLAGEDRIVIEGRLDDARHVATHTLSGGRRDPGPMHGMVARFLIGGTPPEILEAEAEMPKVPLEECLEAAESVKELVGLKIIYGFSREVKRRLGGVKGCTHLISLVLAVGSAAMQGFASGRGLAPLPVETKSVMLQYLKNSCMVWREGGGVYEKLLKEMEEK
jgi:hypothetical protein